MSDERLDPEWTPKKKDVAKHDFYGHLILPGNQGCLVPGCKDADPKVKDRPSIITEKQVDHGN